ncbi:nucleolar/coiled-body phosphoprotein [Rhynchospora pubera]|uniref:Nucleolar/coiled-body phosphoprotein n=1 Tax=Rhynchospora pubera TaxID=906938 RepID=A0AAV8EVB9_9POAL|nr:nucleolar/coiled-body phosphoprotein [Rhynchospora pubera]
MADDIFAGLPPPAAPERRASPSPASVSVPPPPPAPALKSVLKRSKPSSQPPPSDSTKEVAAVAPKSALKRSKPSFADPPADSNEEASGKRLRFRTSVDASETQIIEAMQKIASHIKNPSKFGKASKLALQLIQVGSVKEGTSDQFYSLLGAAMHSLSTCNEPSVRADYHELFTAAQDVTEHFNKKQKNQLIIWTLHAVVANDLHTDDSFVFSKTVTKIKEAISNLPIATADDDKEEAESLAATEIPESGTSTDAKEENVVADPFGLDNLFANESKKHEKSRGKEISNLNKKEEEDEQKSFMKSQREALLKCLEIAAKRYRIPWTQTAIDILVKHAFDNVQRFTRQQREAIEMLWGSIKEQQIRRRQGKSVTGKLDVNAFEWLQEQYSHQKISIRHAVGGGGERRCEQWLG